jgi:hypothetical protein
MENKVSKKILKYPKAPECEKMSKVMKDSGICAEFLDFVLDKYVLSQYSDDEEFPIPVNVNREKLLAEYFGIDLDKVEKERRKILEYLHQENSDRDYIERLTGA